MKNPIAPKNHLPDATEALLEGLIAECHAIIRDGILPAAQAGTYKNPVCDITELMASAVSLADAVGQMRGTAPQPEIRQRITVEKLERLPAPAPEPVHPLSPRRGEGGGPKA